MLAALMLMEVMYCDKNFIIKWSARNPTVILVNGIEQKATEQKPTQQKQSKTSIHEPTKVCPTDKYADSTNVDF